MMYMHRPITIFQVGEKTIMHSSVETSKKRVQTSKQKFSELKKGHVGIGEEAQDTTYGYW